jgi:hypothetical protein
MLLLQLLLVWQGCQARSWPVYWPAWLYKLLLRLLQGTGGV